LVDLDSTNGTTVNGVRVGSAFLKGGERVGLGGTELFVEVGEAAVRAKLWPADRFGRVIGQSPAMRQIFPVLQKLAASAVPVIIEGETGVGKGLVAEAIHDASERKEGPCFVVECTSLDPKLLEVRLFGEVNQGTDQRGLFDEAAGGTLVFDEIAELHPLLQAKLVHAIERSQICRVRGVNWLPIDVRIIATTQRNLEAEVEHGRFREDLFYRLNVGRVRLPPLRQRAGDVHLLANELWGQLSQTPSPADLISATKAIVGRGMSVSFTTSSLGASRSVMTSTSPWGLRWGRPTSSERSGTRST
jgi:DNA-binding NtrC family response regulator